MLQVPHDGWHVGDVVIRADVEHEMTRPAIDDDTHAGAWPVDIETFDEVND